MSDQNEIKLEDLPKLAEAALEGIRKTPLFQALDQFQKWVQTPEGKAKLSEISSNLKQMEKNMEEMSKPDFTRHLK